MVAPMFITFSLHWLFCYLPVFLCDLRHIYHLPINACLFDARVAHILPDHACSTANACFYVCECYVCVVGSVGCDLKAEHGNIMDVLEEKINFFFCSQRYESFPSPKTAYSYLLK